ncbi:MAG: ABC transporter permease, partial [Mycobacteriales bacterium]
MNHSVAAPMSAIIRAQTAMELRLRLRHGESLLLTMVIPLLLLVFFGTVDVGAVPTVEPLDFVAPGILAVAVMSTAFTGQAIATAYERSYGVLKRLGATALPRWGLLAAKTLAVLAVEAIQIA